MRPRVFLELCHISRLQRSILLEEMGVGIVEQYSVIVVYSSKHVIWDWIHTQLIYPGNSHRNFLHKWNAWHSTEKILGMDPSVCCVLQWKHQDEWQWSTCYCPLHFLMLPMQTKAALVPFPLGHIFPLLVGMRVATSFLGLHQLSYVCFSFFFHLCPFP